MGARSRPHHGADGRWRVLVLSIGLRCVDVQEVQQAAAEGGEGVLGNHGYGSILPSWSLPLDELSGVLKALTIQLT